MGFVMGGLILKNTGTLNDNQILEMLGMDSHSGSDTVSMEAATSSRFDGVGIGRLNGLILVLGQDVPFSCSFEQGQLSGLDEQLESLATEGEILCFLVNSISDSYAWSLFRKGRRVRAKDMEEGKTESELGPETEYDQGIEANDQGMITLIEKFTGYSYIELFFEKGITVNAYYD